MNAIAAIYSPNNALLIYDVVGAPFHGSAGVRRNWGDFLQFYSRVTLSYRELAVDVSASGDLAYATFIERTETVARAGGKTEITDNLQTTHVFRKVADKWRIVHEHKSAALPGLSMWAGLGQRLIVRPILSLRPAALRSAISTRSTFRSGKRLRYVANAITTQRIGMEETDDVLWAIYFHTVLRATFDERGYIIQS